MTSSATSPIRVAMVVPSLRGGGLERLVRDLALALDRTAFSVEVHTVGGKGVYAADLENVGIAVIDCEEPRLRIRGVPLRLVRAQARFAPHVVHAHSGTWYPAVAARTLRRGPPLIYTEHGRYPPEPWRRAIVEAWCARRTDRLLAVSAGTAAYLREFLHLRRTPEVLPNGVDLSTFRPAAEGVRSRLRSEWGIGLDEVVAISVGRFVPVKNHAGMIRAFGRARRADPRLRLVLVGTGPLEAEARSAAAELDRKDAVVFLGFRSDVAGCLGGADFFVNASTTEGQPVSILEAMATGLPVVATAVGGVPDVLGSPPAGVLVASGDETGLADALVRMVGEPDTRAAMARLALRYAEAYSLDAFVERHASLYRTLALGPAR